MKAWYVNTKYTADFMATRPFMAFIASVMTLKSNAETQRDLK